jgi:hypothetical protein
MSDLAGRAKAARDQLTMLHRRVNELVGEYDMLGSTEEANGLADVLLALNEAMEVWPDPDAPKLPPIPEHLQIPRLFEVRGL